MLKFSFYGTHISFTVLQSLKILLNMQLNNRSVGSLKSLLLKYNFHFYIYTISTMRRRFILKTVNQISTLFDLGTTDRFFWNEKKKKKIPHVLIYCETKSLKLHQNFWNQYMRDFLESMYYDTKDVTENKVDFISTVTQLSI